MGLVTPPTSPFPQVAQEMFVLNAHPPIHPFRVLCVKESVRYITFIGSRYAYGGGIVFYLSSNHA